MELEKRFIATAFIVHSKVKILTKKITAGGYRHIINKLRQTSCYVYHSKMSCQLPEDFSGKPFYTEEDIKDFENFTPTKALNQVVMTTISDKTSPYSLILKANKDLISYCDDVVYDRIDDDVQTYMKNIYNLTGGIIQICYRIESITDMIRDAIKDANKRNITLPNVEDKKFILSDALTLALNRDSEVLPKSYKEYSEKYKENGFIDFDEVLEGIFVQECHEGFEDSCLIVMLWSLQEIALLKKLRIEDVQKAFIYCREKHGILPYTRDFELGYLAEYLVDLSYDSLEEAEEKYIEY